MSATAYDFPGADVYQQEQLAANTAYQNAVAKLNQQRTSTLNSYGYLGQIDPSSGAISNIRVDPNNPYGQYQTLLRSSAQQSEQAHEAAVGRGLSGGLANQGDRAAQQQYGAGAYQLGTNLQNALSGYDTNQIDAANQRDQAVTSAQQQAASAALQYQLQQQLSALAAAVGAGGGSSAAPAPPTSGSGINAPTTSPTAGLVGSNGQGPGYNPTAPTGGGMYTPSGGSIYYQSNKGKYGKKPLV